MSANILYRPGWIAGLIHEIAGWLHHLRHARAEARPPATQAVEIDWEDGEAR